MCENDLTENLSERKFLHCDFWTHKSTEQLEFPKLCKLATLSTPSSPTRLLCQMITSSFKGQPERPTNQRWPLQHIKGQKAMHCIPVFDPFIFKLGMNRCKFTFPLGWKRHPSHGLKTWRIGHWIVESHERVQMEETTLIFVEFVKSFDITIQLFCRRRRWCRHNEKSW